ncbi:MAG: NHL repeat-containing protein [Bacteroidota bacterium]
MEVTANRLLQESLVFKGSENNPFLAPRGIWITENQLFVSDTGQNRVFIWNNIPTSEFSNPDIVLGQMEKANTQRNSGGVSAHSLQYPSGIWSDGTQLIVADAWNHRVLIWSEMPFRDGQPADVVLGQRDFNGNEPNVSGIGAEPTANTLNWPYGVHSDGKQLWIADTGNRRVLYYSEIPDQSFVPADRVIGQGSFNDRDYDHENAIWPYSVRVSQKGELAITDTQYYRVLLWQDWQKAFEEKADVIIGQRSFTENGQNQFQLKPSSRSLNWCYDSFFDQEGIWVADTGNSRVLRFDQFPRENSSEADDLVGHDDFETGSENMDTIMGTESSLYWPFAICTNAQYMAIADTGNHRVILRPRTKIV